MTQDINFTKLFGFETVSGQLSGGVDFQDETVSAKIGAKVGSGEPLPPVPSKGDQTRR